MKLFLVIFSTILCVEQALCFSAGVPNLPEVCKRMTPRHGKYKPQTSEAPYSVSVEPNTVAGGETVTVTLKSTGDLNFKGFYVQGRGEKGTPIGTFTANKLAETHSCSGMRWNAAHHASGKVEKDLVQITWEAPRDYEGEVNFFGTFVHTYVQIWTGVYSNPLTVTKGTGTRGGYVRRPAQGNSSFRQIFQNFLSEHGFRRNP